MNTSIPMPVSSGHARDADGEELRTTAVPLVRKLGAELIGTFMLTLAAAGGPVIAGATHASANAAAGAVAVGLVLMAMIFSIGPISGAHINPAVTFGFALRGAFKWSWVVPYWIAQTIGGILAAALLLAVFGDVAHVGATIPAASTGSVVAFVMEAALTTMFVLVILGTTEEAGSVGPNAAIAIGGTLALAGLFAGDASGASLNPARSIGPALLSGSWPVLWVYIAGPLLGAAIAVGLDSFVHGAMKPTHQQAEGR